LAKAKPKTLSVGMPLRSEIARIDKKEAKREFGFDPRLKLLVVFGGSQGALSLNRWMEQQRERLSKDSIQSLCVTGDGSAEPREWTFDTKEGGSAKAHAIGFCDRMAMLLSAADLVVSRSGAGSLAEIARCRTPSILIPYPYAADNHQFYNAERMVDQGAAHMLDHEEMEGLTDQVFSMLGNEMLLKAMEDRMERMDSSDARSIIADDLECLIDPANSTSKEEVASA
jgi:UDP-N-acetylglucosamine--N-acetylmuramyl-(pentapeptide) pyrophosphoryl-undecaprenol N-acetylglucosamine transferase